MKPTLSFLKISAAVLLLMPCTAMLCRAQSDAAPSRELLEYIHAARQRGDADSKIKKQALAVGWPPAAVDGAIAYDKSGKPLPAGTGADPATSKSLSASREAQSMLPSSPSIEDAAVAATPGTPTAGGTPKLPVSDNPDEYLIGAGDTLQISIWKELEASVPTIVVRPDGKITMPLIKEISVAGMTPRQAEAMITEKMSKFITDPNVNVLVTAFASKKVYMIGAVRKEGTLAYTYGMRVMQALSEAGGLTDYAKRDKIYVLRTADNGQSYRLDFNYKEVVKGLRMEQNIFLIPGDTVVIPQ